MDPDTNVVLEIAGSKGIKLPSITDTVKYKVPKGKDGYLMYHSTDMKFRYWNGEYWERLNPVGADSRDNVVTNDSMYLNKPVKGNGNTNIELTDGEFIGNGTIPVGGIIMWNGTTIPKGWALCDGFWYNPSDNSDRGNSKYGQRTIQTPDLRGRFIVGYTPTASTATYDGKYSNNTNNAISINYQTIGNNSGADSVKLSEAELPKHKHDVKDYGHSHSITGEIMQKSGATTTEVVAIDTKLDPSHGEVTYDKKISKERTKVDTRYAGGTYTYKDIPNPPKFLTTDCSIYRYICSTSKGTTFLFHSTSPLTDDYPLIVSSDLEEIPGTEGWKGYKITSEVPGSGTWTRGYTDKYFNANNAIAAETYTDNPQFKEDNHFCINPLHDPNADVGATIRTNENWNVKSFDNRPPYYVLAFIMRIK
jgi:microcystin-dependent protein